MSKPQTVFVTSDALVSNKTPFWKGERAVTAVVAAMGRANAADILILPRGPRKKRQFTIAIVHAG